MQITITINTDNAAFEETPEIETARILKQIATVFLRFGIDAITNKELRDINGNAVGQVSYSEKPKSKVTR